MATQKAGPSKIRPKDTFESERINEKIPQTPEDPNAPTKITDLNIDCLEYIFKKLDLIDLLFVADVCKYFKQAASLVYASNYGKMGISMFRFHKHIDCFIKFSLGFIMISDLLICLKLLRCFGHLIPKLSMNWIDKYQEKIDEYVHEYCTGSLKEIGFDSSQNVAIKSFTKSFPKVEIVKFMNCILSSHLFDLNMWFPQMRHLEIIRSYTVDEGIANHFPNLQHLKIVGLDKHNEKGVFLRSNIGNAIRLNQ